MRLAVLVALIVGIAAGQTPSDVLDVFRVAGRAMTEQEPAVFLGQFDPQMPGYETLRANITSMLAATSASSTIEIVSDSGGEQKRELRLDWLLRVGLAEPKRAVLRFALERRGSKWVIVGLEPVEFFAAAPR